MASARMKNFRRLERFLAIILEAGRVREGDTFEVQANAYDYVPDSFVARALPRWMAAARASGLPVHRVLNANLREPSWASNAYSLLAAEGVALPELPFRQYPLMKNVWFPHL
jgi:hypothetical protein